MAHLETLLGTKVVKADDCMGPEVEKMAADMEPGTVLLLENTRFYAGETKNDPELSAGLGGKERRGTKDEKGCEEGANATKRCECLDNAVLTP